MSQAFPEIVVVENGELMGALDIRHTEFHLSIYADRAISFGKKFGFHDSYQLVINNDGLTSYRFVKEHCPRCMVEHPTFKISKKGSNLLNVQLLSVNEPYAIKEDVFIYNEIKFSCV